MSSVTFPTNLGGNGQTYTDDNDPSTGLRDGGWRSRFVPCLEQTVAIANTLTNRVIFGSDVSSTSIAVSTGSKTLTTSGSFTWAAGMFVTIARTSATANYLFGQVVSYNTSTDQLVVNVTSVAGSGTYTDWTIAIAPPGLAPSTFTGPATITVGSGSDALRITQTGAGNALVVEDSASTDSTPFVINTDGNVIVGATSIFTGLYGGTNRLLVNSANGIGSSYFANSTIGVRFDFLKSRGTTIGSHAVLFSGDDLGGVYWGGSDGSSFIPAASVRSEVDGTPGTNDMPGRLVFSTTRDGSSSPTERMRIDNQGRVGIGGTPFTDTIFGIYRHSTGGTTVHSFRTLQTVQSDVTATAAMFQTVPSTAAASFNLNFLKHYVANQGTIGLGSTVSNQFGFIAEASLTGATNNYGFYSNIASGTGKWNFYAAGTADNYFAGSVGIGAVPQTGVSLRVGRSITGAVISIGATSNGAIQSDVTTTATMWSAYPSTQATAFTLSDLRHFDADQGTFGAGSTVTNQFGFRANSSLTGATNNYGFYSNIAAPTSGGSTASSVASVSSTGTTVTVNTSAAHGLSNNQTVTISLTANATALVSGVTCTILAVGTTDFTLIGASSNTVGVSFTATGAGVGSGTVTLNQQNSGKTITVVNTTQFTYTASSSATFTLITASGTVTPTKRYNFYANGTADNYFAGAVGIGVVPSTFSFQVQASNNTTVAAFGNSGGTTAFVILRNSVATSNQIRFGAESSDLTFYTSTTEKLRVSSTGNIYGTSGTTSMTDGFFYIPSAAGAPSGVPTAVSGRVPMYYDTTNNNFYVYNGAWKKVLLA